MEETLEQIEARLKSNHEQRKRDAVRNGTDAEYADRKAVMLKTAARVGKCEPSPSGQDVRSASDRDYEAAKQAMLRSTYRR